MPHNENCKIQFKRTYFTLSELCNEWNITDEQMRYMLENNELKAYLRPALVFYIRDDEVVKRTNFRPIPIELSDLCRLLHDKVVDLELPQQTFPATYDDIVIRDIDRSEAEIKHSHLASGSQPLVLFLDNWTCFEYHGVRLSFGHTQAAVLKYLYEKLCAGNPLVGTKEVLNAVGAHCHHLNNLFNHKPLWKDLIVFPERGYCRLNVLNKEMVKHYQPSLFD